MNSLKAKPLSTFKAHTNDFGNAKLGATCLNYNDGFHLKAGQDSNLQSSAEVKIRRQGGYCDGFDSGHRLRHSRAPRLEGAAVVISSRRQSNVDEAVEKLKARGIEALGLVCHVSNAQQRKDLIAKTVQKYGKIDVIVSNAAANPAVSGILETKEPVLDKLWEINVKTSILLLQALAAEMAPNTRVNCVAPGFVPTNFASFLTENESIRKSLEEKTLLNRLGTTQDMAAATAYLASDDAAYVTGETLVVAGGVSSRL
ncbi:hypothetical protein DH2020_017226 [Rehmannia glutinosa]|uniref:Uncharacterized protein n=1 Tax=Rehmannia glutinosa TaxID=99300 RepID=A0ABR0WSZ6_REHGL